jgi:hypothetical protein
MSSQFESFSSGKPLSDVLINDGYSTTFEQ